MWPEMIGARKRIARRGRVKTTHPRESRVPCHSMNAHGYLQSRYMHTYSNLNFNLIWSFFQMNGFSDKCLERVFMGLFSRQKKYEWICQNAKSVFYHSNMDIHSLKEIAEPLFKYKHTQVD